MRSKEAYQKAVIDSPYISPKELAQRWQCSRSSVDRIARRARLKRLCIGEGKNGTVRYIREEVLAYETKRLVSMTKPAA